MKHLPKACLMFAALIAATLLGGCACSANTASDTGGITVNASSETQVVPDKARISIAVQSQATTAEKCQAKDAATVHAIVEALKAVGVAEESIQTEYTNLTPIQDYDAAIENLDEAATANTNSPEEDADPNAAENDLDSTSGNAEDEFTTIVGYEAYTSLSVEDISIESVDAIAAAAVGAGATDTSGIQYYSSNYDEAYETALSEALDAARVKAQHIADASGLRLGNVLEVTEGYQDSGYRYAEDAGAYALDTLNATGAAKVMPGQIDIAAQVTVRYAIS